MGQKGSLVASVRKRDLEEDPSPDSSWLDRLQASTPLAGTADSECFQIDLGRIRLKKRVRDDLEGVDAAYEAEWNSQEILFKFYAVHDDIGLGDKSEKFIREAEAIHRNHHPNLIGMYGVVFRPPHVGTMTEWCPYGDLLDFILHNPKLPPRPRFRFLCQIAAATKTFHDRGTPIRDLSLENVLVTDELNIKLKCVALHHLVVLNLRGGCLVSEPQYMAPEALERTIDEKCDIFSLGIMFYQLMTNKQFVLGFNVAFQAHLRHRDGTRADLDAIDEVGICPRDLIDEVKDLIRSMWDADPKLRPDIGTVRDQFESLMERCPEVELTVRIHEDPYVPGKAKKGDAERLRNEERKKPRVSNSGAATKLRSRGRRHGRRGDDDGDGEDGGDGEEGGEEEGIRILLRHSRMIADFTIPFILRDLTFEGVKNAIRDALGVNSDEVHQIRKFTRGRAFKVTKDASVHGLMPDTIIEAVFVEDDED